MRGLFEDFFGVVPHPLKLPGELLFPEADKLSTKLGEPEEFFPRFFSGIAFGIDLIHKGVHLSLYLWDAKLAFGLLQDDEFFEIVEMHSLPSLRYGVSCFVFSVIA